MEKGKVKEERKGKEMEGTGYKEKQRNKKEEKTLPSNPILPLAHYSRITIDAIHILRFYSCFRYLLTHII